MGKVFVCLASFGVSRKYLRILYYYKKQVKCQETFRGARTDIDLSGYFQMAKRLFKIFWIFLVDFKTFEGGSEL